MTELSFHEIKFMHGLYVHDVESSSFIHEALRVLITVDQRVDYHDIVSL
jgi:hypothetical protein